MKHIISNILFYLGDFVSKLCNIWPWEFMHPYPLYSWLMLKSVELDVDKKIWTDYEG